MNDNSTTLTRVISFKIAMLLIAVFCLLSLSSSASAQYLQSHHATAVPHLSPQSQPQSESPLPHYPQGCCAQCGCEKKPKSELKLVRTYRKVETPYYGTNQESRYYHAKGMVQHQRLSTDSFVVRKDNQCGGDCFECLTKGGCQLNSGANPNGTHQSTCFRHPTGVTTQYVAVLKWKNVKHCPDCHFASEQVPESEASKSKTADSASSKK